MSAPLTNIVVTCWNALEYTKATLESLFKATQNSYCLTIVDNGSAKETKSYLSKLKVPKNCVQFRIITNPKNMGPGYAANQGFEVSLKAGVTFTCLCNNDLYFQFGWLERLEKTAIGNDNIAMLCPLRPATSVMYDKNLSTAEKLKSLAHHSDWREELRMFTNRRPDAFDAFAAEIVAVNNNGLRVLACPPDALSTCCALLRNSIFNKEFGFMADPIFTHYGAEDSDMSWAVAQRGYLCAVDGGVYVHHFRNKSLIDNNLDRQPLIMDGNKIFFKKWRQVIRQMIKTDLKRGVDLDYHLAIDRGNEYWFLQRLNRDIGFWRNGSIVESKFR